MTFISDKDLYLLNQVNGITTTFANRNEEFIAKPNPKGPKIYSKVLTIEPNRLL